MVDETCSRLPAPDLVAALDAGCPPPKSVRLTRLPAPTRRDNLSEQEVSTFRFTLAFRLWVIAGALVGLLLLGVPLAARNPGLWGWIIFGGAGGVWVFGGLAFAAQLWTAGISTDPNGVRIDWPAHREAISFSELSSVWREPNGYIVLVKKTGKKLPLTPYVENADRLYSILAAGVQGCERRGD